VTNVLIDANAFKGNQFAGVGFSSTDTSRPDSNIEIANNSFDQNGRGIYFFNTNAANVHDDQITNSTVPPDGPASAAIAAFGDVNGLVIMNNDLNVGALHGIRIGSFNVNPNSNIMIHLNNVTGFDSAGLFVDPGGHVGPVDATCNWWGSPMGPTNPNNPAGTGDVVDGDAIFDPWLIAPAPGGTCGPTTPTTTTPTTTSSTSTSSSTTLPPERCGDCVDDDGNGLIDFEDPACCSGAAAFVGTLRQGRVAPRGGQSFLRLRATLATTGVTVNPPSDDVLLQIRQLNGPELLCAQVPAGKFMKMGKGYKFWDHMHGVPSAQGIADMFVQLSPNGHVPYRTYGRRVNFPTPSAGDFEITVGFHDPAVGDASNRCSRMTVPFRAGKNGTLRYP
jgi:hypothetical protein